MKIDIKRLNKDEIEKRGVYSWPVWEKEVSQFDWYYDTTEECFLLEGNVEVTSKNGEKWEFGKGDFVTFPKGLACKWNIKAPVRKHYNFR